MREIWVTCPVTMATRAHIMLALYQRLAQCAVGRAVVLATLRLLDHVIEGTIVCTVVAGSGGHGTPDILQTNVPASSSPGLSKS